MYIERNVIFYSERNFGRNERYIPLERISIASIFLMAVRLPGE